MCTFDFKIATFFWRHWIKQLQVLQSASQAENLKGNFKKYFVFEITCWNEKIQNLIQNMIWRYGKNPHYGPIKIPGPSWGASDVRIRIYLSFSDPPCLYSERKLLERKKYHRLGEHCCFSYRLLRWRWRWRWHDWQQWTNRRSSVFFSVLSRICGRQQKKEKC